MAALLTNWPYKSKKLYCHPTVFVTFEVIVWSQGRVHDSFQR